MARIPDYTALGSAPTPKPDAQTAGYQPVTGLETVPGSMLERAGQETVRPSLRLEQGAEIMQQRLDGARAEDAFTQFRDQQMALTYGPNGFVNVKGANAVTQPLFQTYNQKLLDIQTGIAGTLGNDRQKQAFNLRAGAATVQYHEDMMRHLDQQADIYHRQVLQGTVDTETRVAANHAYEPDAVRGSLDRINNAIDMEAERMGTPAQEVAATKLKAASQVNASVIGQALAAGNTDYAMQWYADHSAELDPGHQATLLMQITNHQYMQMSRAIALQSHLDAYADKQLRKSQTNNEAMVIADELKGKFRSDADLSTMLRTQQITVGAVNAIHSMRDRTIEGHDNPRVSVPLWAMVDSDDPNVRAGAARMVYQASASGQIKGTQAGSMIQALASRDRVANDQIRNGAWNTIRTEMNGDSVEKGMIDLDNAYHRDLALKYGQAQQEWIQRTLIGHEDPMKVQADMLPRYTMGPRSTAALRTPRVGQINSLDDAVRAKQATEVAITGGQLSPEQGQQERNLIGQYAQILQQNAVKAAARAKPAAQGSGKVKVLNVQPETATSP